ncbi:ABC-2 transporter permease [Bacillus cereus group sp. BfR-BA-01380]|uniref:ABC-2 transporter permease n=1 Tax=Bacillus cereus group sp. BfR-BA-01380 TaxID=2920324 RepID=UPI001F595017|nr:ABC-2 transporter permease [Bacillus cereus group sp. BfR-BA-01380]
MRQLVWKEVFLQRKVFLLYLILPIYGALKQSAEPFQIAIACLGTCVLFITVSLHADDKNETEKILISFPFARRDIVIAKYISAILFIGCGLLVTLIIMILPKFLLGEAINIPWYAIFIAVFLATLYAIMVLPLKYGGNKQSVTIFNIMIMFPLIGLLGLMCNVLAEERLMLMFFRSSNLVFIVSMLSIGVCIVYFVSMRVSILIFRNREF